MKHFRATALLGAAVAPFGPSAAKPARHRSHQAYTSSGAPRMLVKDQARDHPLTQDDIYLGMASRALEDKSMPLTDAPRDEDDNDPCAIPFEDATRAVPRGNEITEVFFRSDYLEQCYESLSIDSDNMVEHIITLNEYFREYYCFYNIARDPGASVPREYQPELGYEIWQGGTVDIDARLEELAQDVDANGASLATFWDIQRVFNELRDLHVSLPKTPPPFEGYSGADSLLVSESTLNYGLLTKPTISYVSSDPASDPELTLKISFADDNGTQKGVKTVKTMNGQSVLSFFLGIANEVQPYQTEGARLNSALNLLSTGGYQRYLMEYDRFHKVRPSKLFPESFEVTYTDGSSEMYYHLIDFEDEDTGYVYEEFSANKTHFEDDVNQPGAAYKSFKEMEGNILSAKNITAEPVRHLEQPLADRQLETDESMQEDDQSYDWDFEDPTDKVAYKITDEYGVLKVQSFSVKEDFVIDLWANFTRAAKAKGVKKCMIDISKNGGGYGLASDLLTISMYPKVSYNWFSEQYDQNYNDGMAVWQKYVIPLLDGMANLLNRVSNQDLQTFLEGITPDQERIFTTAAQSLYQFCLDSGLTAAFGQNLCLPHESLLNSIKTLLEFPSGPQMRTLLAIMVDILQWRNPFIAGNAQEYDWSIIRTVNRGGVEQNLTNRVTLTSKEQYNAAVASALQVEHSFDEYLLVSDGASASATALFASSVMQLWANREESGVTIPVKGITYGGTPDPTATSLASAPANVLSDIPIEVNIVAYTVLFLISSLLPDDLTEYAEFTKTLADAKEAFRIVTPVPPYFAHSFPSMPTRNYYSKFMDPGALPLQYVHMPATDHIQQVYRSTWIGRSQDLHDLYTAAAEFFTQNQTKTADGVFGNGSDESGGGGVTGEASSAAICGHCLTVIGVSIFVMIVGG